MPRKPELDIVLVKPGSQKQIYGDLSAFKLTALEPPLWAAILAGYLRGRGYGVALLDAEVENWSYAETARQIKAANPLVAAVMVSGSNPSASTMNMSGASEILSSLKAIAPEVTTLLAGLHTSALPARTMQEETACDYLCQGEGFQAISGLIDALKAGHAAPRIAGLWLRGEDGEIVSSPMPAPLDDLDSLPRPAWDMLPMHKYRAHNWHCFDDIRNRQPYGVLYTSLGCPFRCSFCCIGALFGQNTIRYRSVDAVMAELDFMVQTYGIRNFKIIDEMFALNEKRVTALCDAIISRNYGLNCWAYARVNTITPKMLAKMKQAGINWVAYGFESGSQRVIEDVSKGYNLERVKDVVRMTYETGVHICANYIFGLPEDDLGSMGETLDMALDINAEWANIYCAMAYPGSQLYQQALKDGWPLPATWSGYSQYSYDSLPLPTRHLDAAQVLRFRDEAFVTYYENPKYLEMIERKFGLDTAEHIRRMRAHRLKRKILENA